MPAPADPRYSYPMIGPVYVKQTGVAYVRATRNPNERDTEVRAFGPKDPQHPSVGNICPACQQPLRAGDYTTLIALGPGDDVEEQEKARECRWYNAVALELHLACATGDVTP